MPVKLFLLLMEPVDFSAIYRQNLAKIAAQNGGIAVTADSNKPN